MLRSMRTLAALAAFAIACAHAEPEPPEMPAAMVGVPPPVVTAAPSQTSAAPEAPAPMSTQTRTIADPPPPAYTGRRVDLDVKDADIHNVLRLLADVGHVNIVVADDVQGSVTVRMRSVPWDQALEVVCRAKGLSAERDGNVIIVSPHPR
jgi:type II secretory pathway component HofQ